MQRTNENAGTAPTSSASQATNRRFIDWSAVRDLSAQEVGEKLEIVHQDVENAAPDRWAFCGEASHAGLQFYEDGGFYNHKIQQGGSGVDLVSQYLAGKERDFVPLDDNSLAGQAAEMIAEAFGLYSDLDELRARAQSFVTGATLEEQVHGILDCYEDGVSASLIQTQWGEATRLLEVIGLVPEDVTLAADAGGTGALCFSVAAPGFDAPVAPSFRVRDGPRVASEERGDKTVFCGWTRVAIEAEIEARGSDIHVLDLDRKPRLGTVLQLLNEYRKRGVQPVAVVISSFCQDPDRAKFHLYFRAKEQVEDAQEWEERSEVLHQVHKTVVETLVNVDDEERACLKADPATLKANRIMRLPGFAKQSSDYGGVLFRALPRSRVDFKKLDEQRPQVVVGPWRAQSKGPRQRQVLQFGSEVNSLMESDDGSPPASYNLLARNVWPRAVVSDVSTGESGVLLDFEDIGSVRRSHVMSLQASSDSQAAREAGRALAASGVQVQVQCGQALAEGLAQWANNGTDVQIRRQVSKSGWFKPDGQLVFVNGPQVHGASWERTGHNGQARGCMRGTLEEWRDAVKDLVRTDLQVVVLGLSLAAPLIGGLRESVGGVRNGFGLHLSGPSSSGKTLAAKLAATVWGPPSEGDGILFDWAATVNAIDIFAERMNGALLVLDEIKLAKPWAVGDAIHRLTNGRGRDRVRRSGNGLQRERTWDLTVLSTGEVSSREFMGSHHQGGHAVRLTDVRVSLGAACEDAHHATELSRWLGKAYGVAGDAWVKYLTTLGEEEWQDIDAAIEHQYHLGEGRFEGSEEKRIFRNMAVIEVALTRAVDAQIIALQPRLTPRAAVMKVMKLIGTERRDRSCPEERLYQALKDKMVGSPQLFPAEEDYDRSHTVIGVRETRGRRGFAMLSPLDHTGYVFVSEQTLRESGICRTVGCGAQEFLAWAEAEGLDASERASDGGVKRIRIGGHQLRWHRIRFKEEQQVVDQDTAEEVSEGELLRRIDENPDLNPAGSGGGYDADF